MQVINISDNDVVFTSARYLQSTQKAQSEAYQETFKLVQWMKYCLSGPDNQKLQPQLEMKLTFRFSFQNKLVRKMVVPGGKSENRKCTNFTVKTLVVAGTFQ